jgi:hypothetical protein
MVKRLDGGRRSAPAAPPTASKPKMNPPTWAKNATPGCLVLNSPELRHDELGQEPHLQYAQAGTLIRKRDTNMRTRELGVEDGPKHSLKPAPVVEPCCWRGPVMSRRMAGRASKTSVVQGGCRDAGHRLNVSHRLPTCHSRSSAVPTGLPCRRVPVRTAPQTDDAGQGHVQIAHICALITGGRHTQVGRADRRDWRGY